MVATSWQLEFGGLAVGEGTDYAIVEIEGLANYPDVQTSDHARLRRHGLLPGDDFLAGRTVTVELRAGSTSLMDALKRATVVGQPESEMSFQIPGIANGQVGYLNCKPRRMASTINNQWRGTNHPAVALEFFATDPRIYSAATTQILTLPTAAGGATFNATMNWVFGTISTGSTLQTVNSGTFPTPPKFRIDGPAVNPIITNTTQNKYLAFGLTVGAGQYLEIDTDARTILLNGSSNRYSYLMTGSAWFDLSPGADEVTFGADTPNAGTLTITWRSAWI